ncbi:hypothetical protein BC831DRAFT_397469, partial [Entophlyctis helioformis]
TDIWVDAKPASMRHEDAGICDCVAPDDGSPACGEGCLNRCMLMECDESCPTGAQCSNQAFQRMEFVDGIHVAKTSNRGFGLFTKERLQPGKLVVEYRGEIISTERCAERLRTIYKGHHNQYFLDYAHKLVVDACRKGTIGRFINHSCNPNCRIEKWYVKGEYRIGIFAAKDIEPGSELTYDYRYDSFGLMQPCFCGSSNCRGVSRFSLWPCRHLRNLTIPPSSPCRVSWPEPEG